MNEEEKASGISPEQTELDLLLEEIIEKERAADEEVCENIRKTEEEKLKVSEVRQQAMEKLSESKKRKVVSEGEKQGRQKSRRSGTETVEFLKEQCAQELKLKQEDMEYRRQQHEAEISRGESAHKRQEALIQMLAQQQQLQQRQTANLQTLMAQQNQSSMTHIAQLSKK